MLEISSDKKIDLQLQQDIIGRRIAVLGVSHRRKTNTAAVLVEELLKAGMPLTVVDPAGDYWSLQEKYQILVVGSGEHANYPAGPKQAGVLAELSVSESLPMILDLSDFTHTVQTEFLISYFRSLWLAVSKKRTPYEVIIEVGPEFILNGVKPLLKELFDMVILRGYRRNLGTIIVSQPSASTHKASQSFVTHAEMLFVHPLPQPSGLNVYQDLIPLPPLEIEKMVDHLQPDQAIFVYNHEASPVLIRARYTLEASANSNEGGSTFRPPIDAQVAAGLRTMEKMLLAKLDELSQEVQPSSPGVQRIRSDQNFWLKKRNKDLEAEVARLELLVADQQLQLAALKDFKEYLEAQSALVLSPDQTFNSHRVRRLELEQDPTPRQTGQEKKVEEPVIQFSFSKERQTSRQNRPIQSGKELNENELRRLKPHLFSLANLNSKEVTLLLLLLDYDGKFFSRQEIMEKTALPTHNFYRDFKNLLKTPFIENQTDPQTRIRSRVLEWAKTTFPEADPHEIVRQLKLYL